MNGSNTEALYAFNAWKFKVANHLSSIFYRLMENVSSTKSNPYMHWMLLFFNSKTIAIWSSSLELAIKVDNSSGGTDLLGIHTGDPSRDMVYYVTAHKNWETSLQDGRNHNAINWMLTCNNPNRRLMICILRLRKVYFEVPYCLIIVCQNFGCLIRTTTTTECSKIRANQWWHPLFEFFSAASQHRLRMGKVSDTSFLNNTFENSEGH